MKKLAALLIMFAMFAITTYGPKAAPEAATDEVAKVEATEEVKAEATEEAKAEATEEAAAETTATGEVAAPAAEAAAPAEEAAAAAE